MRLNATLPAVICVLIAAASGCVEGGPAPGADVTVTEMVQQPDGSWATTTRKVLPGEPPGVDEGDGVERARRALNITPCSHDATVALWAGTNYSGNVVCLRPSQWGFLVRLPFEVRSGYTMTPIYVFQGVVNKPDASTGTGLVFHSCDTNWKWSSAFSGPANFAQRASERFGVCHF